MNFEDKTKLKINASFLSGSACNLRNFYILLASLSTTEAPSIEIVFGQAFHSFAANMVRSSGNFGLALSKAKAVQAGPSEIGYRKDYLAESLYLTNVCTDWDIWRQQSDNFEILTIDGEPLVEKSFEIKVYEDDKLIIYLCGTIDKLGKFVKGCYGFGDYKTTSKSDVEIYFAMYRLRVQLRTYMWAIMQHGKLYPDSIWSEMAATPMVAFIEGIFLSPPSKGSMAKFIRSELFQAKYMNLDEYEFMLNTKIQDIVRMFYDWTNSLIKPRPNGILEGLCDYCKFASICSNAHNETLKQAVINQHFVKKVYDPADFGSKE